ncbi:MAG: alkaline phosphatase family protein [Desulfatibacillum sp.]|nr:alkaline phosphatase family protein [Desulfatibacillum sp.]
MAEFFKSIDRRTFLKGTAATVAGLAVGAHASPSPGSGAATKTAPQVIVLGIDGMDPVLTQRLMQAGRLPHFARLRDRGGFSRLSTTNPPQSPVAWASFINGAGPGSHGLFDFIHRDPTLQCQPFYSGARTTDGEPEPKSRNSFWNSPFFKRQPQTRSNRQGVPFWDYLDQAGIPSVFYDLPANYPPTPSSAGNHQCLSGMGVPDLMGTHGTYQYFSHDGPDYVLREGGGQRTRISFHNSIAKARLEGPQNPFSSPQKPVLIEFSVQKALKAESVRIGIQGQNFTLRDKEWSPWIRLEFVLETPFYMLDKKVSGICRFYLKEVNPGFQLYVSPINADPADPAIPLSEPENFVRQIAQDDRMFYTTGFQEDHKALSNGIFSDQEFENQARLVLEERANLLDYAMDHYRDGLLFFYFSTLDLLSHMFWTDSGAAHSPRSGEENAPNFSRLTKAYEDMDRMLGKIMDRFGSDAAILVLSDHGFAGFQRQFNLNSWLRDNKYLDPAGADSILSGVDWANTRAYGLGINGLYVNLKGREREGIVKPGHDYDNLLDELAERLETVLDESGRQVIKKVHRADRIFQGPATAFAPDLIIGYSRGYRASWATCLGELTPEILMDNRSAWCADHCCDASEVPGVLFSSMPLADNNPAITDLAPTILSLFGINTPYSMDGKTLIQI